MVQRVSTRKREACEASGGANPGRESQAAHGCAAAPFMLSHCSKLVPQQRGQRKRRIRKGPSKRNTTANATRLSATDQGARVRCWQMPPLGANSTDVQDARVCLQGCLLLYLDRATQGVATLASEKRPKESGLLAARRTLLGRQAPHRSTQHAQGPCAAPCLRTA